MTLCGQTIEHCPHWMHRSGSQIGTCSAMLRFSYFVVPVGKVPSIGIALTGKVSPRPSIMTAVTLRTNSGAVSGTILRTLRLLVAVPGIFTSQRLASALSMAAKFLFTTSVPLRA